MLCAVSAKSIRTAEILLKKALFIEETLISNLLVTNAVDYMFLNIIIKKIIII